MYFPGDNASLGSNYQRPQENNDKPRRRKKKRYQAPDTYESPTFEPCVHRFFKTEPVERECLTREQYMDMLATPKGYPWLEEANRDNPELSGKNPKKKKNKGKYEDESRKQELRCIDFSFAEEFINDMWDVMSPDVTDRLIDFLVQEFGMTVEEAEDFIDCKSSFGKPTPCVKKQSKALVSLGPKHKWVKKFSDVFANRIEQYIVIMLMAKKTPQIKKVAQRILSDMCNVTGDVASLQNPKTKRERTMALIATRLAFWVEDIMKDLDKPRKERPTITEEEESEEEEEPEEEEPEEKEEREEEEKEMREKEEAEKPVSKEEPEKAPTEEKPAEEEAPAEEQPAEEEAEEEKPADEETEEEKPVEESKPAEEEVPVEEEPPTEEEKPEEVIEEEKEVEEVTEEAKLPEAPEEIPAEEETPETVEAEEEKPTEEDKLEEVQPVEEEKPEGVEDEEEKPPEEEEKPPEEEEKLPEEDVSVKEEQAEEEPPEEEVVPSEEIPAEEEVPEEKEISEKEPEKIPSEPVPKKSPIVIPRKPAIPAFEVRVKTGSTLQIQKLSSGTVVQQAAKARGVSVPPRRKLPASESPLNLKSAEEWVDWASNIASMADEWGKWLESRFTDAEKHLTDKRKHSDWKAWMNQAQAEALKWRVEEERIKDEGEMWGKKLEKQLKDTSETVLKVDDLSKDQ